MSIEWVNQAIDDLRAWGRARGVEVDADEVRLLCDYASDYLDVNEPGDFTAATLDELLLSIYPRKVITPPESAPQTVAAARTLVDYLQDNGEVDAATAGAMRERIDDIAPRMSEALADESNFGMAKSLFSSIGPESLEQSIAIPSGELPDLGEAPCDCPGCSPLPGVRLAAPGELLEALARVPLWTALREDAPEEPYRHLAAGLRQHLDTYYDAGRSGAETGDGAMRLWAAAVAYLVDQDTRGAVTGSAELDEELYDLFDMLYRLRTRVPVAVIGDYLQEVVDDGDVDVPATLDRLAWCGLIEMVPGPPGTLPPRGLRAGGAAATPPSGTGAAPGGRPMAPVAGRIGVAVPSGPDAPHAAGGRRVVGIQRGTSAHRGPGRPGRTGGQLAGPAGQPAEGGARPAEFGGETPGAGGQAPAFGRKARGFGGEAAGSSGPEAPASGGPEGPASGGSEARGSRGREASGSGGREAAGSEAAGFEGEAAAGRRPAGGQGRAGGPGGATRWSGGSAGLTPLAVWALREHYLALGIDAPLAPDLAESDATGLVEGLLDGVPTEMAEDDIARWLSRRTPGEAAAQLLAAASGAPAVARGIAVTIVDRLGAEAEPEVRACLDDAELRPHAIHWLASRGLPTPALTQDELLWVSVDMLALAMPAAQEDPDVFAENMAASGPPAHLIEEMWRVDHPDVVDVLELLGRSIPDGTVAKAARKAAFKARSRAIR
ncbi:hypothetical protein HTZ77_07615 [Nonomuraea sp. SMC257]|uniref:Uncharacterized protein n=1 Tax=Nonomuraea montanisoli TaxID=2741721 RepID=A0A7Y6I4B7_9ACTN|nr:hypothetical protein [Nonomuraea montanisoli]NUW31289.1 hypothetical protein [Nonomuraea montanisoli]